MGFPQVAICSLSSGIGEASLLAMASFYEAKARLDMTTPRLDRARNV